MRSQEHTGDSVYFSFSSPVLTGPPSTKQPSPTGKQHPLEPQKQVRKPEDLDNFQPQETRERKRHRERPMLEDTFALLSPLPNLITAAPWRGLQYGQRTQVTDTSVPKSFRKPGWKLRLSLFLSPSALTTALTFD